MSKLVNRRWGFVSVVLLLVVGALWWFLIHLSSSKNPNGIYQQQRILRFNAEISNSSNRSIEEAEFNILAPIEVTSNQRLISLTSSEPYIERNEDAINRIIVIKLGLMPPFGRKVITVTAAVDTAELPNQYLLEPSQSYTQSEPLIESDNQMIKDLARELKADLERDSIKNIHNWVAKNITFKGYLDEDRGALYALETKSGDSSEFMFLTIALARAMGIPARGLGGFVYSQSQVVSASDYHNWTEVYIDNTWQIVDPQNSNVFENSQNYIALNIFPAGKKGTIKNTHEFFKVDSGLTVRLAF